MNAVHFDRLTRTVRNLSSRRGFMRGIAVATGLVAIHAPDAAGAKKKKKNKLKVNKYGCVNVGGKCRGQDKNCCSGRCQGKQPKKGKKDKSRCVAHNVLDCPPAADECQDTGVACGTTLPGTCFRTTGRASFCAFTGICKPCQKDTDCGPGGACAVCPGCGGIADTACLVPAA
jgi:hypothetical protein